MRSLPPSSSFLMPRVSFARARLWIHEEEAPDAHVQNACLEAPPALRVVDRHLPALAVRVHGGAEDDIEEGCQRDAVEDDEERHLLAARETGEGGHMQTQSLQGSENELTSGCTHAIVGSFRNCSDTTVNAFANEK